jgi:hypothetical protein
MDIATVHKAKDKDEGITDIAATCKAEDAV